MEYNSKKNRVKKEEKEAFAFPSKNIYVFQIIYFIFVMLQLSFMFDFFSLLKISEMLFFFKSKIVLCRDIRAISVR